MVFNSVSYENSNARGENLAVKSPFARRASDKQESPVKDIISKYFENKNPILQK